MPSWKYWHLRNKAIKEFTATITVIFIVSSLKFFHMIMIETYSSSKGSSSGSSQRHSLSPLSHIPSLPSSQTKLCHLLCHTEREVWQFPALWKHNPIQQPIWNTSAINFPIWLWTCYYHCTWMCALVLKTSSNYSIVGIPKFYALFLSFLCK